jgi:hypothetical protein
MDTTASSIPGYSGAVAAIVPGTLYIAERPGGGGRSQRIARRHRDLAAAAAAGVATIVSLQRSRHGLIEYAQAGFGVRWHPLRDVVQGRGEIPRAAEDVADVLARDPGAVLVHVDRWGEWTTAAAAALMVRLDISPDAAAALDRCESLGLPVGDLARDLLTF